MNNQISNNLSLQKLPLNVRAHIISNLPKVLRPALRLVPFQAQRSLLLPALHSVFKEAIADGDFEFLQNKWLRITITDIDLHWYLSFDDNRLIMASQNQIPREDVSFSASGDDLLLIAGRKQDPDTLFFQRRLKIEGDTELGLEVKNLIDAVDFDSLPSSIHKLINILADIVETTNQELKTKQ